MGKETNPQERAALEQKVADMVQQSKVLETYLNDVMTREAAVSRLIDEARLASEALQALSGESVVDSMIPLGIGIYARSTIGPLENLLVSIGAGVTVEKSRASTIDYIESRIKEFELGMRQLNLQKQQVTARLNQIQNEINTLIQGSSK
ncbi:MAG: prefoldin subunit alpha [Thermoproteota archaeon]|nr:prefoldin subunit alpha [Thermoproteota archaeon]